jgi:hypothetical protein
MRDKIFISHANPEDNEFARWLTLRLISEGYPVWCDLVRLKGGEDFWRNIEEAIRERTAKFIYVLSRVSNVKLGPLQELAVAKAVAMQPGMQDFVLPLHIDDLAYNEMNIEIKRLTAIPFESGWAKGLQQLLEKLDQESIAKDSSYTPFVTASWWRDQFSADKGVLVKPEEHVSNWFDIESLPEDIYFHLIHGTSLLEINGVTEIQSPHPVYNFGSGVFTFAPREEFKDSIAQGLLIPDSHRFRTQDLLQGKHAQTLADARQARNAIVNLLMQGWRRMVVKRRLGIHAMANDNWCFYFVKDQIDRDRLNFTGVDGHSAYRYIMGYKTLKTADGGQRLRYWHFGLSAKAMVYPRFAFAVRAQVLFSYDGKEIWQSVDRLHRARMSQCRNWWNDDWRDRILATMNWLAESGDTIAVPLGGHAFVNVRKFPLLFRSEVSFIEPGEVGFAGVDDVDEAELDDISTDMDEDSVDQ